MSQVSGEISIDEGYRDAVAGEGSSSRRSGPAARAERSSPGEWDESLGNWGAEEWKLPGQGESGNRCGEWQPSSVCCECAHLDLVRESCGNRSCPNCWGIWAKKAAVRATKRIQAYRHTQPDDHRRQVAHAFVSPPEGEVMNERQYYQGRKKAAEIAEEKGFVGFLVVPHPFRVTDEARELYNQEDPEYGIWVWLRDDVEEMEEYIYWSPHYHIIGITSADMEPAKESDDWAYHFKRSLERYTGVRDQESHDDLYGLCRYLLSHTGYPEGSSKQAVTWYGKLSNSVFVEEATEEYQHEKPSDGILSALEREIEEVADVTLEDDGESGGGSDDVGECPVEECGGVLIDVFDISRYLQQATPPPEVQERMQAARDWRHGERVPPPGMQRPQTEGQAREAFEALL
jgi:Zn-finger nucleic acid-binding protein